MRRREQRGEPPTSFKTSIGNRTWTVILASRRHLPRGTWSSTDLRRRVITVRRDLSPENFLSSLIHEVRYAQVESTLPAFRGAMNFEKQAIEITETLLSSGMIDVTGLERKGRSREPRISKVAKTENC